MHFSERVANFFFFKQDQKRLLQDRELTMRTWKTYVIFSTYNVISYFMILIAESTIEINMNKIKQYFKSNKPSRSWKVPLSISKSNDFHKAPKSVSFMLRLKRFSSETKNLKHNEEEQQHINS